MTKISFSQAQSINRCEWKWKLSYIDGWRPKRNYRAANLGLILHSALAKHYTEKCGWEGVRDHIRDICMEYEGGLSLMDQALRIMKLYIGFYEDQDVRYEILDAEKHFEVPLTSPSGIDYILQGYIDLMTRFDGDKIWIWDHKSSAGNFWNPMQVLMDGQMPIYGAALRAMGINVHGIIINQLKTYDYKDWSKVDATKIFKRDRTYRTDAEFDSILYEAGLAIDRTMELREKPHLARRNLTKECSFCSFQEVCLMSMKGLDIQPILRYNFTNDNDKPEVAVEEVEMKYEFDSE